YRKRDSEGEAVEALLKTSEADKPIEKVFRKQIHCENPQQWTGFETIALAPERYEFDYVAVTLYAFMPGDVWYDNVRLVPMTDREIEAFRKLSRKEQSDLPRRYTY